MTGNVKLQKKKYLIELLWLSDLALDFGAEKTSFRQKWWPICFLEQGPARKSNKKMRLCLNPFFGAVFFFPVILENLIKAASILLYLPS